MKSEKVSNWKMQDIQKSRKSKIKKSEKVGNQKLENIENRNELEIGKKKKKLKM